MSKEKRLAPMRFLPMKNGDMRSHPEGPYVRWESYESKAEDEEHAIDMLLSATWEEIREFRRQVREGTVRLQKLLSTPEAPDAKV